MAVSYIKLWKLLLDKNLKKCDLKIMAHISSNTLAKMGKNEYIYQWKAWRKYVLLYIAI